MRLLLLVCTVLIGCVQQPERAVYNYASDQAWVHCVDVCPGERCPCILGEGNTWYVSPEVGEE